MGSFPISNGYSYILFTIDYVSQWVEAIATKTNDVKVVVDFLKSNIFYRFGMPKALISDQGSHFYNRVMSALLHKYGVVHRITTAYHPRQTVKLNSSIGKSRKHYKRWPIPTGRTGADSLKMIYGHTKLHIGLCWGCLPTRLFSSTKPTRQSSSAIWYDQAGKQRKLQLQELEELRLEAYKNSQIYKQKVKQFHDRQILRKEFRVCLPPIIQVSFSLISQIKGLSSEFTPTPFHLGRIQTDFDPVSIPALKQEKKELEAVELLLEEKLLPLESALVQLREENLAKYQVIKAKENALAEQGLASANQKASLVLWNRSPFYIQA
ncbi:gag-pol, partial [Mucuna pruriens]